MSLLVPVTHRVSSLLCAQGDISILRRHIQPPRNAQETTTSRNREAAMLTRIFALTLALLTITAAPAHANFIRNLDADVNLNFGPSEQLTGEMPINVIPP